MSHAGAILEAREAADFWKDAHAHRDFMKRIIDALQTVPPGPERGRLLRDFMDEQRVAENAVRDRVATLEQGIGGDSAELHTRFAALLDAVDGLLGVHDRWVAEVSRVVGRPPDWDDKFVNETRAAQGAARGVSADGR